MSFENFIAKSSQSFESTLRPTKIKLYHISLSPAYGNEVTYSCRQNSSRSWFPNICTLTAFLCLSFISHYATYIHLPKAPLRVLNLKLKYDLAFINFPRRVASQFCRKGRYCTQCTPVCALTYSWVRSRHHTSTLRRTNMLVPIAVSAFFYMFYSHKHQIQLRSYKSII